MLIITCPNSPKHEKFIVTAHVSQLWKVDSSGEFLDEIQSCVDVTHFPESTDVFECSDCGARADVESI